MTIVRLRVELEEVEPVVVRTIEAPASLKLDRLHRVIQAAMGWENCHLHEFGTGEARWGLPDPDFGADVKPENKATLEQLIAVADGAPIRYLYDFGDSWEHRITIEDTFEPVPGNLYPRLVDVTGRCPPEDVGGSPGYEYFLQAIDDPEHEEHDHLADWYGGPFDPNVPDADELRLDVLKLANKWKPRRR